mgnify:FL=1
MTEKNVLIFVRGEQQYEGVEPDVTELMTEGTMIVAENGDTVLSYQETELTGMEGTLTCFIIHGDTVTLARSGAVSSQIVFQKGKQHSSFYETPWGALSVDVTTSCLAMKLGERGGVMEIKYCIAVEHQVAGRCHFKIRVRERMR